MRNAAISSSWSFAATWTLACESWRRVRCKPSSSQRPDWSGSARRSGCESASVPAIVCPAAGQGALAIECRADDARIHDAVRFLDDADTRFAVTAERAALNALGGGCQVPIGAYCFKDANGFVLHGAVAQPDGALVLRSECRGDDAAVMGHALSASLLSKGAAEILADVGESK